MGKQDRSSSSSSRYGSERLLYPVQVIGGHGGADHLADLDEEDVWSVLAAAPAPDSGRSANGRQPEQDRRGRWTAGGLSLAFEATAATATAPAARHHHHHHHPHVASSAPVKVPEWPAARFPPGGAEQQQYYGVSCREEEGEWVAPHEYLQARSGGRGAAAPSVFEGVGRTLKGRDLSRVRDAVWSSTGFFG